jgi:IS30 family transposase
MTFVRTAMGSWQYKPHYAQTYAEERHKYKPKPVKLTEPVKSFVREKLKEEWSPDQISGYGKRHQLFSISREWVYQFILKDKQLGNDLYRHLRHQHKKYRKRYGSSSKEVIRNRRSIDKRPKIVDNKTRVSDWEVDTIIGKDRKQQRIYVS